MCMLSSPGRPPGYSSYLNGVAAECSAAFQTRCPTTGGSVLDVAAPRQARAQLCPDGLSSEKNSWEGSSDPGRPCGVSRVIGWLKSTADGSLTWAQSVTMLRVVNFQVPLRFSYLSR